MTFKKTNYSREVRKVSKKEYPCIIISLFLEESDATVIIIKERYFEALTAFKSEVYIIYSSLIRKFWFKQDEANFYISKLRLA